MKKNNTKGSTIVHRSEHDYQSTNNVPKRNTSVDFFRFFFIIMICLWHFSDKVKILYHGYLGVEFFFMLSGMFLYRTYCYHPEINALNYTTRRFVRFFPKYIICLIPIFVLVNYQWLKEVSLTSVTDIILRFISEGLMLQSNGLFPSGSNYPMWFLSVLLLGGGIIYSILRTERRRAIGFIFPLLIVFSYMYIFSDHKSCIERWGHPNGFYIPFVRGMADICMGVMLMTVISNKKALLEKKIKTVNFASIISLIFLVIISTIEPSHDQYCLIFIPSILIGCFIESSFFNRIFNHHIWNKLGNISYEMFLIHALIVKVYAHTIMPFISSVWLIVIVYLAIVILTALLINWSFSFVSEKKWFQ